MDLEDAKTALRNAHEAGDVAAARRLADIVDKLQGSEARIPEGMPEGMMFDPNTGQIIDTNAMAEVTSNQPGGSVADWAVNTARGVPGAGSYVDEAIGAAERLRRGPEAGRIAQEVARKRSQAFEERNPTTSLISQLGAGLVSSGPGIALGQKIIGSSAPMAAKIATGGVSGGILGAAEGAVHGFGDGDSIQDRIANAKSGAMWGGGMGTAIGGVMPGLGPAITALINKGKDRNLRSPLSKLKSRHGIDKQSAKILAPVLEAGGANSPAEYQRMKRAGQEYMLADNPQGSALLDASINRVGGSGLAGQRVTNRMERGAQRVNRALDATMGKARGMKEMSKELADKTRAERKRLFDAAHATPIDYASKEGRKIEEILSRIEPKVLKPAIDEANAQMLWDKSPNRQIMADIGDDGKITFMEMPNVGQLHEIKVSLQQLAESSKGEFGQPTKLSRRYSDQAREIRKAIIDATRGGDAYGGVASGQKLIGGVGNPGGSPRSIYEEALKAGMDKIRRQNALRFGEKMLNNRRITREDVIDEARGATPGEREQIVAGARSAIDERMAAQRPTLNQDADLRAAQDAWKSLGSGANRTKLEAAIADPGKSLRLFGAMDEAGTAFRLAGNVAQNSKTHVRKTADDLINRSIEGPIRDSIVREGSLFGTKDALASVLGVSKRRMEQLSDDIYRDLANALTVSRGGDAREALQLLGEIARKSPRNADLANKAGAQILGGMGMFGATTGTRQFNEDRGR